MFVFVKSNHYKTGSYRVAESYSVYAPVVVVEKIEDIKQECSVGIFVGFLPQELSKNTTVKFKYYLYCSPFGQMDLSSHDFYSAEFRVLRDLKYAIIKGEIMNAVTQSKSLAKRMGFIYTPPCMNNIEDKISEPMNFFTLQRKNYGFLGNNLRKHRNVVNQIAAISRLEPKEKIVVRDINHYINYSEMFDCEFTDKRLESDYSYFEEISTHRLGFLCSWSEAFSYQALEYAKVGVPVIHGPCIDWYPEAEDTIVENIDNPDEIRGKAQFWIDNENGYKDFSLFLKEWFTEFNDEQREKLFDVLTEVYDNPKRNEM